MSSAESPPGFPAPARRARGQCLCFHTQRAARALARRFDEVFRPLGLNNGQFSLMMVLAHAESPPAIGAVADTLAMDRTTLTAKLKPLARRGLVTVTADASDRRTRRLALTQAGRALLAEALPLWRRAHAEVERVLGDPDRLRAELRALA